METKFSLIKLVITQIIGHINFYCTTILTVSTLLAYASKYVNPLDFELPAYFGMMFPYILIIDVVFIILLLIAQKKTALILLAVLVVGYSNVNDTFQSPLNIIASNEDEDFTIMSFNVRQLDRYNWIKDKNDTRTKIFEFLKYESPDIVCIQEFYNKNGDSIDNRTQLKEILKTDYVLHDQDPIKKTDYGHIIFSRYEIKKTQQIIDGEDNVIGLCADIETKKGTVRVINVQLKSIKLDYSDYNFIDSLNLIVNPFFKKSENNDETDSLKHTNNIEQLSGFKSIFSKIDVAYKTRIHQIKIIKKYIDESIYPTIVCGDFNEPPLSYCYNSIIGKNYIDAFTENGSGFGTTMRLKFLIFRIDYILHSKDIKAFNFKTHNEKLSDHNAISCSIKVNSSRMFYR